MQHHELLREEERNHRFTVQDAIDVLPTSAGFEDNDFAEIRVGGLRLPSDKEVGLPNVFFSSNALGKTLVVSLPTSAQFKAIRQGEADARLFSIFELDGAKVDNNGSVRLSDGTVLRAVEVIPENLPLKPSELDWLIVHHTIWIIGAEDRCYRSLREHAKPRCLDLPEDIVPDIRSIDCGALKDLELPSLKYLAREIAKKHPMLKKLSHQKIADALRTFGMRIPRSRSTKVSPPVSLP
jgi:hypothetical protein